MLGVDPRAFRITWTIFLFALLLGTLYAIRDTLLLFAVSIFFAYMLAPLVELAERMTLKHRGIALAIVFVVLVGALVALGLVIMLPVLRELFSFNLLTPIDFGICLGAVCFSLLIIELTNHLFWISAKNKKYAC